MTGRRGIAAGFAAVVVRFRVLIVVAWIATAAAAVLALPSIKEAQTGALGDLVPAGADAIKAEERSAELFAFPLSSRTLVVERDADGLPPDRVAATARVIRALNRKELPELRDAGGAYGITNAVPLPFARERGTTAISYLLFPLDIGPEGRRKRAENFVEALAPPPSSSVGVTGAIPARAAQADAITSRLPLVELVTVLLIALTVGLYLRSIVAPLVTLVVVAVAYLAAVRGIAGAGSAVGVSIPSEVEPVLVALLFGVVTDYALFFMSRFRALIAAGDGAADAARHCTQELAPIVLTCGIAVAAGSAALAVAELGFLRAFGPAMAVAVLISLLVVLTLLPALLAILGGRLFLPSHPSRSPRAVAGQSRTERLIRAVVKRPVTVAVLCLALIGAMGSGILWLEVGNPLIRGLPSGSEPRQAYEDVGRGFAPGVVAPTTLVVEGEGIAGRARELRSLQALLGDQPGIAGVLGPATSPRRVDLGLVRSPTGDAARYVMIPATDPLGADAIRRLRNLRERVDDLTEAVGLEQARASFSGDTALVAETIDLTNDDIGKVLPAVLLAVTLVLVAFLRALVAPLYLVLLAALAPLASLGLAVGLFQGLLGQELTYFVPIVAAVLLVSLGSDYNVFIAGSIWAEARRRPLREAVVAGGSGAAHAIAAAGVVLAASFAALALVPVRAFQELAFVLAAGLLIDAFLIRLVLAPAVIVLAERRRARDAPRGAESAR